MKSMHAVHAGYELDCDFTRQKWNFTNLIVTSSKTNLTLNCMHMLDLDVCYKRIALQNIVELIMGVFAIWSIVFHYASVGLQPIYIFLSVHFVIFSEYLFVYHNLSIPRNNKNIFLPVLQYGCHHIAACNTFLQWSRLSQTRVIFLGDCHLTNVNMSHLPDPESHASQETWD